MNSDQNLAPNIQAFLRVLDPEDNATGGGTASAVAGAMAAALVAMVCRLSVGKQGMEPDIFYQSIQAEAEDLAAVLFEGGRKDAEAFDEVKAAFRLHKGTPDQKDCRQKEIQAAMVRAAELPLGNARSCSKVLDMCARLRDHSNPNAASDLACAAYLSRAGALGCIANVEINLPGIKNPDTVKDLGAQVQRLRNMLNDNETV